MHPTSLAHGRPVTWPVIALLDFYDSRGKHDWTERATIYYCMWAGIHKTKDVLRVKDVMRYLYAEHQTNLLIQGKQYYGSLYTL